MVENSLLLETDRSVAKQGRLRVLRISHSAGVSAYRERERQILKQMPVDLLLIKPERWEHLGTEQTSLSEPFDIVNCPTFGTGNIPLFAYDPRVLIKTLREFKPQIVDVHEEPYSVSCFETFFLVKQMLPQAVCLFYSAQNILKRYPPPFSFSERFVYRHADGAYPCSALVYDVLRKKGYGGNASVIPLAVDNTFFRPLAPRRSNFDIPQDDFVIGYFGRFEECKGVHILLKALGRLKESLQFTLVLAGSGAFENNLKALAQELGISERLRWFGVRPVSEMPQSISLCDVAVVPSMTTHGWKEQFGRAVVEAMACGVPVIASDSGSLREVTADAGIVVPEGDDQALATQLLRLANNKDLHVQLRRRGLKLVEQKYTWRHVAALTADLYANALQARARREHIG